MFENKDGNRNIAVGYQSGSKIADGTTANTTGDNNIFIGADTKANADGDQNEIVIGDDTTGHGSNTVTIGNDNVIATYLRGDIYKDGVLFGGGKFVDGTDPAEAVYSGNVGIGTNDPSAKLQVVGESRFTGTNRTSHFNYSTNEDTYIRGGKTTSNVYINDAGGNVGIGTTSPTQKLEVNGGMRASYVYGNDRLTGAFFRGNLGTNKSG